MLDGSVLPAPERLHSVVHSHRVWPADDRHAACRRSRTLAASSSASGGVVMRNGARCGLAAESLRHAAACSPAGSAPRSRWCWDGGWCRRRSSTASCAATSSSICGGAAFCEGWAHRASLRTGLGSPSSSWSTHGRYAPDLQGARATGPAGGFRVHHAVRRGLQVLGRLSREQRHGARHGESGMGLLVALLEPPAARLPGGSVCSTSWRGPPR